MAGVAPVFFKATEEALTIYEICKAAEETSGEGSIHGAQRIRGLWRLYPKTPAARVELLAKGTVIKGRRIDLLSRNPFLLRDGEGKEIPVTKLFVAGVPISFSNEEIVKSLKKLGFVVRSKLDNERVRDPNGQLTNWVTGRRMCWVETPKTQMPQKMDTGLFQASLYYKEMIRKVTCNRCLQEGHRAVECKEEEVCRKCRMTGHRMASCPTAWVSTVSAGTVLMESGIEVSEVEKVSDRRKEDDVEKCGEVPEEGELTGKHAEEQRKEEAGEEEVKSTDGETDDSSGGEVGEGEGGSEKEEVPLRRKEKEGEKKKTRGIKEKRRQSKKNEGREVEKGDNPERNEKKERGREILKETREKKTNATLDSFVSYRSQSRKRMQSPDEPPVSQRPKLGGIHYDKKV